MLALTAGLALFLSTGHDDAYITFWSAHSLLELGEIVNYSGDRVEQSSSLLHTLWLALSAGVTRQPLPVVGYWTGVGFGVLAVFRAQVLCGRLGWGSPPWLPFVVATLPISLYWWFGGLETTLAAWLSVELAIVASDLSSGRKRWHSASALGVTVAYLTVRPEAFAVLLSALGAWLLIARGAPPPRAIRSQAPSGTSPKRDATGETHAGALRLWALATTGLFLLLVVFRLAYFGQAFPQPVYAKVGAGLTDSVASGLAYTVKTALFRPYALTFFASLLGAAVLLARRARERGPVDASTLVLLLLGANTAFVLFAGGDWMRGGRFFAHFAPLALVAGAGAIHETAPGRRAVALVLTLALLANGAGVLALALGESSGRPLWSFLARDAALRAQAGESFHWSERANRVRTRDLLFVDAMNRVVDQLLERTEPVTIMSRQAGMVMFYVAKEHFGRIRFIDAYGLTSPEANALSARLALDRRSTGTQISPPRLIEALEQDGGAAARPDVVFDIYPTGPELSALGYETVYSQSGSARGTPLRLGPLGPFELGYSVFEFVAVDGRWAELFPERPKQLQWNASGGTRP